MYSYLKGQIISNEICDNVGFYFADYIFLVILMFFFIFYGSYLLPRNIVVAYEPIYILWFSRKFTKTANLR